MTTLLQNSDREIIPSVPQDFSSYYNAIRYPPPFCSACYLPTFLHIRPHPSIPSDCRIYFAGIREGDLSNRKTTLLRADISLASISRSDEVMSEAMIQTDLNSGEVSLAASLLKERMRMDYTGISDLKVDTSTGSMVMLCGGNLYHCLDDDWPPSQLKSMSEEGAKPQLLTPTLIPATSALLPALCPVNPNLVAFVMGKDLAVAGISSSDDSRQPHSTSVHNLTKLSDSAAISAGSPSFVIQEEFNRYVGFWWRPCEESTSSGNRVYTLLFEETDESNVEITYLPLHGGWNVTLEPHRYPKPGKENAKSNLKIAKLVVNGNNEITEITIFKLFRPLFNLFPEFEYLVRAGWSESGSYPWVQLMDRVQSKLVLLLLPMEDFIDDSTAIVDNFEGKPAIQLLLEEDAECFVEPHDCLHFLPMKQSDKNAASNGAEFIWMSRRTGYWHIFHIVCHWSGDISSTLINIPSSDSPFTVVATVNMEQLTFGDWEVLHEKIFVDVSLKLVIFEGLREHPLFANIYAVGYDILAPLPVTRLSSDLPLSQLQSEGLPSSSSPLLHSIAAANEEAGLILLGSGNHMHLPGYALFQLVLEQPDDNHPASVSFCQIACLRRHSLARNAMSTILNPLNPPALLRYCFLPSSNLVPPCPDLYSLAIKNQNSVTFYGILFSPNGPKPPNGFPTLHIVYGGPGVQLVKGAFSRALFLRAQLLCHFGYAVLLCDCRGSTNRGIKFENHHKLKLGIHELDDHVAFLNAAAEETGLIDLNRVAIHGTSYGGYLSLMAAARYRSAYIAAIAGSPVVDWLHYDTAYTERYLGLPDVNADAYINSSVLTYADEFPNYSPYLLISHGGQDENVHFAHTSALLQKLDSIGKPYELLYYPASRHGVREDDHLTSSILCFLDRTLLRPTPLFNPN